MDSSQASIEHAADQLALTLADVAVHAELQRLLAGTDNDRQQQRRLEVARRELIALEMT
jgi:hypothetical protein